MYKKYWIETKDRITTVRFLHKPETVDICNALDDVVAMNPADLRLWDFTCGLDLTDDDIEKVVNHANSIQVPAGKIAIVAPQDLTFGVVRVFIAIRKKQRINLNVFRSETEARYWLEQADSDYLVNPEVTSPFPWNLYR